MANVNWKVRKEEMCEMNGLVGNEAHYEHGEGLINLLVSLNKSKEL